MTTSTFSFLHLHTSVASNKLLCAFTAWVDSCDCAGTCVGERNRRKFVLYLCLQTVEAVVVMNYVSEAISLQSSVDEWFRVNAVFLVGWVTMFFVVAITIPLLIYQTFLISTNQTSWEHARRQSITYLRDLPTDRSPFDRGVFTNCWVFLSGGDSNRWVHDAAAPLEGQRRSPDIRVMS